MSGHTLWTEIRSQRPRTPEQEAAIAEGTRAILRENALMRLRQNQRVTQQELATAIGVSQVNISRIEREDEPQLSTMRRFIEALGGELIVQARIDGETFDLLTAE
ncbi:MAG: helix-turn-helix domain-containing protein [Thermomicrobiales bacterium]